MAENISNIDRLLTHFRKNTDRVITVQALSEKILVGEEELRMNLGEMVGEEMIYEVGDGRYIHTNNSDLVAFEIFRGIAPNISYDEFIRYKDEEHILMRMSRDRDMAIAPVADTEYNASKKRGNNLS